MGTPSSPLITTLSPLNQLKSHFNSIMFDQNKVEVIEMFGNGSLKLSSLGFIRVKNKSSLKHPKQVPNSVGRFDLWGWWNKIVIFPCENSRRWIPRVLFFNFHIYSQYFSQFLHHSLFKSIKSSNIQLFASLTRLIPILGYTWSKEESWGSKIYLVASTPLCLIFIKAFGLKSPLFSVCCSICLINIPSSSCRGFMKRKKIESPHHSCPKVN